MNKEFCMMYHDALAKAFFIVTPGHARLAIFPYSSGHGDLPLAAAKSAAMKALDLFNEQIGAKGDAR